MSPAELSMRKALLIAAVLLLSHRPEVLASAIRRRQFPRHTRQVGFRLLSKMPHPSGMSLSKDKSASRVLEEPSPAQVETRLVAHKSPYTRTGFRRSATRKHSVGGTVASASATVVVRQGAVQAFDICTKPFQLVAEERELCDADFAR